MSLTKESKLATQEEFDPIAYIEKAFTSDRKEPLTDDTEDLDVEIPSIGEYLQSGSGVAKPSKKTREPAKPKSLSAPRPRRVKGNKEVEPALNPALTDVWARLPKNVEFLGRFFDDSVTANYYTGEFKESRQELIRRLLDPELNLEEVSRLLGVCPATVRRYTNRGWLDHHRTKGGQRRFRLTGVVKFVEEHGRVSEE